ncbi:MAG TPA: apolipoprotein N-acyltransferase [Blastocatellia bacterium]|nr:apolipoprotein N-acyltransferase [Blastocatellia bacterium]
MIDLRMAFKSAIREEAVPPVYSREDLLAARFRVARVLPYQQSHAPFVSNLLLAVFSGLLMIFAFPEWNWWSLGWVCTAPLVMAVARERRFWSAFILGWTTGTIFYMGSSYWVTYSMHHYGDIALWLSYVILLVFSATLGVFTALFAGLLALVIKRFGGWAILAAPVLWAASEWLRLQISGVGWNALGYSQAFQPSVIAIARLGGVYMVSALLVAASTALVFGVIYFERRRGFAVLTAVILLAIISVLYGERLRAAHTAEAGSVNVAVIQPNVPIGGDWDDERFVEQMLTQHFRLSEQALQNAGEKVTDTAANANHAAAGVVIWPESPMNFEYDRDLNLQQRIASFTRRTHASLLMNSWGFPKDSVGRDTQYNSALVIAPSGEKIAEYDKMALVPFGEYIPARKWFPFAKDLRALVGDITPGTSFTLGAAAGARLGTLICFEATRPDLARRLRRDGATALVQISNESWFGPTSMPRQMLAEAVFRAVENNVDVIRATNSGLSAFVHPLGQTEGETPMFETATRVWQVKTADEAQAEPLTFYTRHGDVFAVACAILSLILVGASFIPEKEKVMSDE